MTNGRHGLGALFVALALSSPALAVAAPYTPYSPDAGALCVVGLAALGLLALRRPRRVKAKASTRQRRHEFRR